MSAVTPMFPSNVTPPSEFDLLLREIVQWLNILSSSTIALDSIVIDRDEQASRARACIQACDSNLHRLMNELERWEMTTRLKVTAPEVGA